MSTLRSNRLITMAIISVRIFFSKLLHFFEEEKNFAVEKDEKTDRKDSDEDDPGNDLVVQPEVVVHVDEDLLGAGAGKFVQFWNNFARIVR